MDASKLIQQRMERMQNYSSNWQPRDASEITTRQLQMSQKNNSSKHNIPVINCCSSITENTSPSTTYSEQIVFQKKAGCVQCNDPNFGKSGGVVISNCCNNTN
jgi:hypothetical protein